jgi:hypothetical protein
LAWLPQSSIAGVCARAAIKLSKECPWAEILLQVHDSLVFQIPTHKKKQKHITEIRHSHTIPIPYPDPHTIPWGLALSEKSWGDIQKKKWEEI